MMYIELFAGAEQLSCLYQKQRTYLRKFGVRFHRITEWWRLAGTPGSIWHNSFSSRGTQGKRAHNPSVFHFVPMASCKKATFPCYFGCYIENFSHWTDFFYLFFFFPPGRKVAMGECCSDQALSPSVTVAVGFLHALDHQLETCWERPAEGYTANLRINSSNSVASLTVRFPTNIWGNLNCSSQPRGCLIFIYEWAKERGRNSLSLKHYLLLDY